MKAKVIFIIGVFLAIGLFCGLAVPAILDIDDSYKGKVVFYTEQEYTQFKTELIKSDAKWDATNNDIEVLNNEPPIIVTFDVSVSQDYNFKYGKITHEWKSYLWLFSLLVILGIFVLYMYIAQSKKDNHGFKWSWLFTKDNT
jgi:hypothetical protein